MKFLLYYIVLYFVLYVTFQERKVFLIHEVIMSVDRINKFQHSKEEYWRRVLYFWNTILTLNSCEIGVFSYM